MIRRIGLACVVLAALGACGAATPADQPRQPDTDEEPPALGLLTTLPIYWPESGEFGDFLRADSAIGPVRQALEQRFRIEPMDVISASALSGIDLLVLAQPRALSPQENVDLDSWVREGGRTLIFADPMLTGESRFAIGDRRRPQDVILLSPILRHWGLDLTFDPEQDEGEQAVGGPLGTIPVRLPGTFRPVATDGGADCTLESGDMLALCRIGRGVAVILADAHLLEEGAADTPAAQAALASLVDRALQD